SWLTGTAAWNYVAITQWILGVRPTYEGLKIAPVIPSDWDEVCLTRIFRGVTYQIKITRAGTGNAVTLVMGGQPVTGNIVPFPTEGSGAVSVEVTIG
ncbi:MAG: glycosyl transferase, partial [Chloroflexota bacterium]|nr:glycosyl transferase [Chloroflexota bacterium]